MIIDNSYFVGELHISQVGASASNRFNNNDLLQSFIDQYEVELMNLALGRLMSKELFDNIDAYGKVKTTADVKWLNLVEGVTYTFCDVEYCWRGLRDKTGRLKTSLIAYYVYYKYMTDNIIHKSTMGTVRAGAENSQVASAIPTLTRAWRNMIEWYGEDCTDYGYYQTPTITYKRRGVLLDYLGTHHSKDVSLYRFLSHNKDVYEDFEFTPLENKNQFQI